jgi:arylsulfatase A-like enzyme/CubicO group peptidase (beta-lactamase class C family)
LVVGWGGLGGAAEDKPNIVVIFTDDQGYGDLGCFGSTSLRTPRLDRLADEGTRFTSFYAQVVCGPSRSALLTGRYPHRSLGWSMPASEVTIAEVLRPAGYVSACIGKWDVSNRAAILDRMPKAQGFDYFYGTLGANDNGRVTFHENDREVGATKDMASLTRLYTDKSIEFIKAHREQPFFLYLAHTMAHSVIDASPEFKGKSAAGLYGDTIEELDFHAGRLLDTLDELGLREKTLVIFTTDNGAWNNFQEQLRPKHQGAVAWGSSGPLREGKGSTYEGGLRVPCLARWPGRIPAARTSPAIFATIDLLPTFASMAGVSLPKDRWLDGVDQTALLLGKSEDGARQDYFYFCKNELHGVRRGSFKLLLADRRQHYNYVKDKGSATFELYDLATDIGEQHDLANQRPELVRELTRYATSIPFPDTPPDDRIATSPAKGGEADRMMGGLVMGQWEGHGFLPQGREPIRRKFEEAIAGGVIPGGALMLLHRGEVVMREAFGVAELDSRRPFSVETPCRIASLTKPHTATLLVMLEEQGWLRLDDTVDRYLPEFQQVRVQGQGPARRSPTIRECLSHTAGFPGNDARRDNREGLAELATLGEVVARLAGQELMAEPGTRYDYSGYGYMVAGRVAEVVTGRCFQDLMRRQVLAPLGMTTATFVPSESLQPLLPEAYDRDPAGKLVARDRELALRSINPGGGLISTLDDLGRFLLLHRNRGKVAARTVVTAQALERMYQPQPSTKGQGYGLGFNLLSKNVDGKVTRIQHTGASGTLAMLDFERDFIVILLTQVDQKKIIPWREQLLKTIAANCFPDSMTKEGSSPDVRRRSQDRQ